MPTYEYECKTCKHRFERFQPITAGTSLGCPRCKKRAKRLISSGAGLLFKGQGFYATDYRSSGYKKQAKEESQARSAASKESKKSSSSKPKKDK